MKRRVNKSRYGFSLIELMTAMVVCLILAMVTGLLTLSGNRAWHNTYAAGHSEVKGDAQDVSVTFMSASRKANRLGYILYERVGDSYYPVEPEGSDLEIVAGDAVEFRYWDVELDADDSHELMDVTNLGTAYTFFYLDNTTLKVDYGQYPPGAVPEGGGRRNTSEVTTRVLANNVSLPALTAGPFSHTTQAGAGMGSVRINVIVSDQAGKESVRVMTAGLIRNIWPR